MNKFTPGPWEISVVSSVACDIKSVKSGYFVAMILDDIPELEKEWKDNAKLIAAAPDLFKALEDIIWKLDRNEKLPDYEGPARITRNDATVRAAMEVIGKVTS
jgi:hypothetical protein